MSLGHVRFGMACVARSNRPGSRGAGQYAHSHIDTLCALAVTVWDRFMLLQSFSAHFFLLCFRDYLPAINYFDVFAFFALANA